MLIVALTWLFLATPSQSATSSIGLDNVPRTVRNCMTSLGPGYRVSKRLNPFYVRGDFDGNGVADYAVSITESKSGREGFVVCFGASPVKPEVLAAGRAFPTEGGTPVDDFATIDVWGIVDRCGRGSRDCLYLEKAEAGGGLLVWNGRKFIWRQQGI